MLKSHQRGDLTSAETKVDNLPFAKVLYEERNGIKRFGGGEWKHLILSQSQKNESVLTSLQKRRLDKTIRVGKFLGDSSVSSSLCPFFYQGKVNILKNE